MRWFKHRTDAADGEFLSELIAIFGLEGYARWFILLEKIGARMDKTDGCSAAFPVSKWKTILRAKDKIMWNFLKHCEAKGKVNLVLFPVHSGFVSGSFPEQSENKPENNSKQSENILEIKIPNLLLIRDNYSKNLQATNKKLASKEVEVEVEVEDRDKDKDKTLPAASAAGVVVESEADKLERLKKNPENSWNAFILAWADRYGRLPAWSTSIGSGKEFVHLAGCLKKTQGDKSRLLECFTLFLADEDRFLIENAHRPALLTKRLDIYLNRIEGKPGKKDYGFAGRTNVR